MYLVQRHQTWWAFHDVPPSVRPALGRSRFSANLKTRDRGRARVLAAACEARWLAAVERARHGAGVVDPDADPDPATYRRALRLAKSPAERDAILEWAAEKAAELATLYGDDDRPSEPVPEAAEFYTAATALGFADYLDGYAKTLSGQLTAKTVHMRLANLRTFGTVFATVADIRHEAIQQWIYARAAEGGARATITRAITDLRLYRKYLVGLGAVDKAPDPFEGLTLAGAKRAERKPFAPADLVKLEAKARARGDAQLADFMLIAMYTGARAEEIATLRCEHIDLAAGAIAMPGTKSDAARREVPIHPALRPVVRRLVAAAKGGPLFRGLRPSKFQDIGGTLTKRFHTLKVGAGFGEQFVFHSIRATVATLLEDAGVAENIAAAILGHELKTMSYGLYSGGPSLATKAQAIKKLRYPK